MSGKADFSVDESTAAAKTIMQSVGAAQTPLLKALSEDVTPDHGYAETAARCYARPGTGGCGGEPEKDLGIALHQGHT